MSQMDYFRRPFIVGRNLNRTINATIRGSIRRNDPDGSYNAAYYPGVTAGLTLLVTTQAGSFTVTFSSVVSAGLDYNQAITSITAALTGAIASDSDGVISITSTSSGAAGLVSVTGGTAAAILGFDVTTGSITAQGGEISSSPEGRIGNPYGTALPTSGENLSLDMIARGLARISSNTDVLHSDSLKEDAILQKIGTIVGDVSGKFITLTSTTRVFNGFGTLSAASTPEEIAPYFVLVDPTTKRPLGNRVVSVVIAPAAATEPPYTNATSLTDTGKNILGLNLTKFGPTAITTISNNQVLTSIGVGTASVQGDVVSITGAGNTSPWSNNGTKWIVEKVIGANSIMCRPMSKGELNQYSVTLTEIQPVLELNTSSSGSLGSVTVSTGMYTPGVSLVVRPLLSASQSVEVWAAMPSSLRANQIGIRAAEQFAFSNNRRTFRGASDADVPLTVQKYSSSTTGDVFQALNETGTVLTKVTSAGTVSAPILAATTSVQTTTIDTATAAGLTIGATNANGISAGKTGVTFATPGGLRAANLDTITASAMAIGGTNATAITIGKSGVAITAPGNISSPIVTASTNLALSGISTPGSPSDGYVWYDTSLTPPRISARINGANTNTFISPLASGVSSSTSGLSIWKTMDGIVHIQGGVIPSTTSTLFLNFPVGYRFSQTLRFTIWHVSGSGPIPVLCSVSTTLGLSPCIVPVGGGNGTLSTNATIGDTYDLSGISFLADS